MNHRIEKFPLIKSVIIFVLHIVCKFQKAQTIIYVDSTKKQGKNLKNNYTIFKIV